MDIIVDSSLYDTGRKPRYDHGLSEESTEKNKPITKLHDTSALA